MMESPFFRSHWNNFPLRSVYSPSVRQVPVQRQSKPTTPKVVSVPVHFVSSERTTSDSALKIQKVFRGFLVRKSVKKIASIRREVNEIEKRISKQETVELIREDSKESLRVNETLMNLLFRLDSVTGVDSGVRECRKAVIKKVIALQERMDSIVAGDQTSGGDAIDETLESNQAAEMKVVDEVAENPSELQAEAPEAECSSTLLADCANSSEIDKDRAPEIEECVTEAAKACVLEPLDQDKSLSNPKIETEALDLKDESQEKVEAIENEESIGDPNGSTEEKLGTNCETESQSGSSPNPQGVIEGEEENSLVKENDGMEVVQDGKNEEKVEENCTIGDGENTKKNKDLLERMIEDNDRMMGLMAELFQRNEMQTKLLSSLSQRVGLLEKAFVCDKLRKKKKRCASGTVDCLEKSEDSTKKCGGKR
ncbi:hypothetical protein FEM48_Zijuj10G0169400 [Ziziphus jujuba var. spinosa]|uniref:BAG domain-containing protein n=1 Tax=Ziziphus jujuba var. spinosa TaxID=714518 RepID=A0A978UPL2_ZIZJJ|nr:hypothetical protein FEM48_Zijuj10G0169400 [Ziziphus jujuba var. spinosa]